MSMVLSRGAHQFQQKKANEQSLGSYYTDPEHCRWLSNFFEFSKEEETTVLEPCAGDGVAVVTVTQKQEGDMIRIFVNEIKEDVAQKYLKDNPLFESVIDADFKDGVFITNNAFSFCFGNPPYMTDYEAAAQMGSNPLYAKEKRQQRLEKVFLEKVTNYLCAGGILCWIIPHRIFIEDSYCSWFMSRYEPLGVYKFHEKEFAKWGQIAIIGRKRGCSLGVLKEARIAFQERCSLDNLDLIPMMVEPKNKIKVPPQPTSKIANFRTVAFDPDEADVYVKAHPECVSSLNSTISKKSGVMAYNDVTSYSPPKRLSPQNLALLTACGVGSGYAGNGDDGTLHLQRGSVTTVTDRVVIRKKGKSGIEEATMKETTRAMTNIVLIEADGTITDLVKTDEGKVTVEDEEDVAQ